VIPVAETFSFEEEASESETEAEDATDEGIDDVAAGLQPTAKRENRIANEIHCFFIGLSFPFLKGKRLLLFLLYTIEEKEKLIFSLKRMKIVNFLSFLRISKRKGAARTQARRPGFLDSPSLS
jgi:hypothetical protein